MYQAKFENKLCSFFNARAVYTLSKGRAAFYAILKVLGLGPGDEVIMPGYTCMVVPAAAIFQGCKPVYVDIEPHTFNINPEMLESLCSPRSRALIVQHTYGIPAKMDKIMSWAKEKNIIVIEDCCLAFGSRYNGQLLGTFGEASFFSGQWSKPFSTGLGGMLVVPEAPRTASLATALEELIEGEAHCPGLFKNLVLWSQIQAHRLLVRPRTNTWITGLYRLLSRMRLMIGSSSNEELDGHMPKEYFSRMSSCQASLGCREMDRIEENITRRRHNAAFYDAHLEEFGLSPLEFNDKEDAVLVRYPVRVGNKKELLGKALAKGIELGSWFESPLHPLETDLSLFSYEKGMCPESEKACLEVINLPTHRGICPKERQRVLSFLRKYAIPPRIL